MLGQVITKDEELEGQIRLDMQFRVLLGRAADATIDHNGPSARGQAYRDEIEKYFAFLNDMEDGIEVPEEEKQKLVALYCGLYDEFHCDRDKYTHVYTCEFSKIE